VLSGEIMIYVLTPACHDFEYILRSNKLKRGHDVLWVDKVERLYGRKILPDDVVIKGDKFFDFNPKEIHRIEIELAIRRRDI
jgi:hypothetical protein